jgi:hypothetical protein
MKALQSKPGYDLCDAITALESLVDGQPDDGIGEILQPIVECLTALLLRDQEDDEVDLSFADDYDESQLRAALLERVKMIHRLRAHRDALLDEKAGL